MFTFITEIIYIIIQFIHGFIYGFMNTIINKNDYLLLLQTLIDEDRDDIVPVALSDDEKSFPGIPEGNPKENV